MLIHSCAPNCTWGVSVYPQCQMEIRTTTEVQKGDILSVSYTNLFNAFGTHKRQELMQDDGEFICKCLRCCDPTELNAFCSALICSSCGTGNVLPLDPLDITSDWKCTDCNAVTESDSVNSKLDDLMTKLENCESVTNMVKFIEENQGITVHRNHWLITEAEDCLCKDLARTLGEIKEEVSLEEREKQIQFCSHFLSVKNLIAPGISLERGKAPYC
jgi:hypothetical protein